MCHIFLWCVVYITYILVAFFFVWRNMKNPIYHFYCQYYLKYQDAFVKFITYFKAAFIKEDLYV